MSTRINDTQPRHRRSSRGLTRYILLLLLVGLAGLTAYQFYRRQNPYQVRVFATTGGWGYDIVTNNKTFIHQPTIPGQPGIVGFSSQEQAQQVGDWVVEKIQQTKALPTLTNDELRRLGVKIP